MAVAYFDQLGSDADCDFGGGSASDIEADRSVDTGDLLRREALVLQAFLAGSVTSGTAKGSDVGAAGFEQAFEGVVIDLGIVGQQNREISLARLAFAQNLFWPLVYQLVWPGREAVGIRVGVTRVNEDCAKAKRASDGQQMRRYVDSTDHEQAVGTGEASQEDFTLGSFDFLSGSARDAEGLRLLDRFRTPLRGISAEASIGFYEQSLLVEMQQDGGGLGFEAACEGFGECLLVVEGVDAHADPSSAGEGDFPRGALACSEAGPACLLVLEARLGALDDFVLHATGAH